MLIRLLPAPLRKALALRDAFNRQASGQATPQDKTMILSQNRHWNQLALRRSTLSPASKKRIESRRNELAFLIQRAEKANDQYKSAKLWAEWFGLTI